MNPGGPKVIPEGSGPICQDKAGGDGNMEGERGYRFHEHTADIIIEAWAPSLEGLFEEAAKAITEVMTDPARVEPREERRIESQGFDLENLLLRFLEEILVLHDSEGLLFRDYKVHRITREAPEDYRVQATAWGEKYDPRKHESRTHVKAITYALMEIKKENGTWRTRFTIDI